MGDIGELVRLEYPKFVRVRNHLARPGDPRAELSREDRMDMYRIASILHQIANNLDEMPGYAATAGKLRLYRNFLIRTGKNNQVRDELELRAGGHRTKVTRQEVHYRVAKFVKDAEEVYGLRPEADAQYR